MKLLRKEIIFILVLVLCISVAHSRRQSRKTSSMLSEWQQRKLERIQLLAKEGGLPSEDWKSITKYDEETCYERDCLDSALEIMGATNFTVDPCKENMWLDYVCARRVNGADNINQLERLMKVADKQTKNLLEDTSGKLNSEYLLQEAQTYYHQCKNKALNDNEDVRNILEYIKTNYGEWPILSNRDPPKDFDWFGLVADLNKLERFGYKPLLLHVQQQPNGKVIMLDLGQTSYPISGGDIMTMLKRVQKASGLRKPARFEQAEGMLQYVNAANYATLSQATKELVTIQQLQKKTDDYIKKADVNLSVNWMDFFTRVYNGSDIPITQNSVVQLPFSQVMAIIKVTDNAFNQGMARSVANALEFQLITMLLQETTVLLDDLNTFKCTEQSGSRDQICQARVQETFGYSLGKTFLKVHYNDALTTPAMENLMSQIQRGYIHVIEDTPWMEDSTKEYLKDKIQHMKTFYVQPDWLKKRGALKTFFEKLRASKDKSSSYPLNYLSVNKWQTAKKMAHQYRLGMITSLKDFHIYDMEWNHYLGTVQAQFHKAVNEARIEGGITQSPIYSVNRPGFMNFGGLGMVLAHEIGHSFDVQGRKFNKDGQQGEFWDKNSVQKYNDWVQTIITDYSSQAHNISETSAETIDATQTVNEDIADILGVYISYFSYEEYLKDLKADGKSEKVLPGLKNFAPEKLFYMKYGNMWCDKKDVQDQYNDLFSDHSSGNTRATMPLKRSKQFAATFGCKPPPDYI